MKLRHSYRTKCKRKDLKKEAKQNISKKSVHSV